MNKKLPNVFANKNANVIDNNEEIYYSKEDTLNYNNESITNDNIRAIIVRKKINDLFNSDSFVYKVRVVITTAEGDRECTLIHRSNDRLLTINNESILIRDILDIRKL